MVSQVKGMVTLRYFTYFYIYSILAEEDIHLVLIIELSSSTLNTAKFKYLIIHIKNNTTKLLFS